MSKERQGKGTVWQRSGLVFLTLCAGGVIETSCQKDQEQKQSFYEPAPITTIVGPQEKKKETFTPVTTKEVKKSFPSATEQETDIAPSLTPEANPTSLVTVFPRRQITSEFIKQGFFGIGSKENFGQAIEGYASQTWREPISLTDLTQDEVKAMKAIVAFGSQTEIEGFYQPGEVFSRFGDLSFLRFAVDNFSESSGADGEELDFEGVHLTILGGWEDEEGEWALGAVDRVTDAGSESEKVREHHLVVMPQNSTEFSLEALLQANGHSYNQDEIRYYNNDQCYSQKINNIDLDLARQLEREAESSFAFFSESLVSEATLTPVSEPQEETPVVTPGAEVVASALNVREGPSVSYSPINVLEEGEEVEVVGRTENNWLKIGWLEEDEEQIGWISGRSKYVSVSGEEAPLVAAEDVPPTPTAIPTPTATNTPGMTPTPSKVPESSSTATKEEQSPSPTPEVQIETQAEIQEVFAGDGWEIDNRNREVVTVGINPSFVPRLEELMKEHNTPSLEFTIFKNCPVELGSGESLYSVWIDPGSDGPRGIPARVKVSKGRILFYPQTEEFDLLRRYYEKYQGRAEVFYEGLIIRAITGRDDPRNEPLFEEFSESEAVEVRLNYLQNE